MKAARGFCLAALAGWAAPALAGTCSLCRETLAAGGRAGLVKGFYWSIILIVSFSLVFIGLLVRYAWRAYRPPAPT